ncbi:MAG: hypothetical protein WC465_01075 [Patescibacteria group bacterium]
MLKKPWSIVYFFRLLWIILSVVLICYVIGQNVFTGRTLVYDLDFTRPISRNTDGWYPQQRLAYEPSGLVAIKGEPLYLKVYLPVQFETLLVKGTVATSTTPMRLGLRQKDGGWFFKGINEQQVAISFMLDQAKVQRRQLELILSMPGLSATSTVEINNNWQLIFQR